MFFWTFWIVLGQFGTFGTFWDVWNVLGSIRSILQHPDLDQVLQDLDPASSGSGFGFAGSLPGEIRVWIRSHRISTKQKSGYGCGCCRIQGLHELSYPVEALVRGMTRVECAWCCAGCAAAITTSLVRGGRAARRIISLAWPGVGVLAWC